VVVLAVQEQAGHKAISIDAVRELQHQAYLKPFEGSHRVFILDGAELLTEAAANALLKTLEEPPAQVLLILTTAEPERLLPTIRSRCQRLDLRPLPEAVIVQALETRWRLAPEEARRLARLSRGCIGWAIRAAEDPTVLETRARRLERLVALPAASLEERFAYAAELASLMPQQRTALREILEAWASAWRDMLVIQSGAPQTALTPEEAQTFLAGASGSTPAQIAATIRAILRTGALLELNVNPRLALEALMLALP
jgi:DNA polymerase-3 subunit delta'